MKRLMTFRHRVLVLWSKDISLISNASKIKKKERKANLSNEQNKSIISFPFVLLNLKYRGGTLQISSLEVGAQELRGSLRGSLFIESLRRTLARAGETLMTHVSPSSSSLCFDWLELQRWHAPAASASLKALILHSKLFNSHIKTCKIWLRPR